VVICAYISVTSKVVLLLYLIGQLQFYYYRHVKSLHFGQPQLFIHFWHGRGHTLAYQNVWEPLVSAIFIRPPSLTHLYFWPWFLKAQHHTALRSLPDPVNITHTVTRHYSPQPIFYVPDTPVISSPCSFSVLDNCCQSFHIVISALYNILYYTDNSC
jgi:hypothetical protein